MRRREFLGGLAVAAAWPLIGNAQQAERPRRIGLVMAYREGDDPEAHQRVDAFRESLRAAGWIDGQNSRIEVRWSGGDTDRAQADVRELVDQSPDVIVVNGAPAVAAARQLTSSIPIVFVVVTNPVEADFVQSMSRPGGNVTGFSAFEPQIGGKWVETLKEAVPHLRRVGVLIDPRFKSFSTLWLTIQAAAPSFGVQAISVSGRDQAEIDSGIQALSQQGSSGLIVLPTPTDAVQRQGIFLLTAQRRLPAIYPFSFYARSGGLMAYGIDSVELFRRSALYVSRILKG